MRDAAQQLVHFLVGEHEEMTTWLWFEQTRVISHETVLSLHGLSDLLPVHAHLTPRVPVVVCVGWLPPLHGNFAACCEFYT